MGSEEIVIWEEGRQLYNFKTEIEQAKIHE
jgi:hypothetical protein